MMKPLSHIYLQVNFQKEHATDVAARVSQLLTAAGAKVYVDDTCRRYLPELKAIFTHNIPADADMILVVGGDGSILDIAPRAVERDLPLLGINLGRLGYLAEVAKEELQLLTRLMSGAYTVSERMTLTLAIVRGEEKQKLPGIAFNEVAITHENNLGLCDLLLTDSDCNRIRYRGDGLVIATPSGSTAYSFSCGGPVMHPDLAAICVTPICPHSFFNRSMILPSETEITVECGGDPENKLYVSLDGRNTYLLHAGEKILVCRGDKRLRMITFEKHGMMNTLRQKMQDAELKD